MEKHGINNNMSKAIRVAMYLKNTKNLTLNTLYSYCREYNLSSSEIEFVKGYINGYIQLVY